MPSRAHDITCYHVTIPSLPRLPSFSLRHQHVSFDSFTISPYTLISTTSWLLLAVTPERSSRRGLHRSDKSRLKVSTILQLPTMALRTISCLTIAGLAILGGYSLHVFGENNGLFPAIVNLRSKHVLPTSSETATVISFPETFTGYDPPDGLLATLLVFFWPFVDGSNPGGSLLGVLFAGQTVAVWTAAVLEGSRMANKWKIVSL